MKVPLRHAAPGLLLFLATLAAIAQSAPPAPNHPWHDHTEEKLKDQLNRLPKEGYPLPPQQNKPYSLAELIDLAEQHNPDTRLVWQQAKARAAELGIARSAWYPTIAALAIASTARARILLNSTFYRQTYGNFSPELHAEYLVLDFGGRSGAIDAAKWNLLASDLSFNDLHRKIIFQVMAAYYQLLNAQGQREAAEVSLRNAQAVEADAQARLNHGLATKPDLLEAQASTAQAEYNLQAVVGVEAIARGNLATVLGSPPETTYQLQQVDTLNLPTHLADSVNDEIQRAIAQRPDLKALLARMESANATIRQQRSSYFPTLSLGGDAGLTRQYGQQNLLPPTYAGGETWDASLSLKWTLFDGGLREHRVAQARAEKAATQAQIESLRDQIANDVWAAYSNVQTALRQRQAAVALLTSANQSYDAARESYNYGVRNILDVVSAQKTLAQARSEDITAQTQVLFQVAALAFQTGDLVATPPVATPPAKTGP